MRTTCRSAQNSRIDQPEMWRFSASAMGLGTWRSIVAVGAMTRDG